MFYPVQFWVVYRWCITTLAKSQMIFSCKAGHQMSTYFAHNNPTQIHKTDNHYLIWPCFVPFLSSCPSHNEPLIYLFYYYNLQPFNITKKVLQVYNI